jgi:hypothetical protein
MRRFLLVVPLLLAFVGIQAQALAPVQPAAPAEPQAASTAINPAGKVELAEGDVTVYDKAKKPRAARIGDTVFEGEGIVTGKDGELHLNMEDGGFIAVRPNTKMRIAAYQARGTEEDKGVFSLLQGAFRSVTGWIGKYNPRAYQVRTPTATIGVRGTDHEPLVIPQGSQEGEPGTYDKVNIGGSYLQTKHGRVDVPPNQAAYAPLHGKPVPRLLPQVPNFFRSTRNEHLLAGKHEAIHKVIEQRRNERRKVFEQQKKTLEKQKDERRKALEERKRGQDAQRQQQREDRKKQWQERRAKQQNERGLQQGEQREKRQQAAEERRKRLEGQHAGNAPGARSPGDPHERRKQEREHGHRGGGRGRE